MFNNYLQCCTEDCALLRFGYLLTAYQDQLFSNMNCVILVFLPEPGASLIGFTGV